MENYSGRQKTCKSINNDEQIKMEENLLQDEN